MQTEVSGPNFRVCLKPKPMKIPSKVLNLVLNYSGPRYRKNNSHTMSASKINLVLVVWEINNHPPKSDKCDNVRKATIRG